MEKKVSDCLEAEWSFRSHLPSNEGVVLLNSCWQHSTSSLTQFESPLLLLHTSHTLSQTHMTYGNVHIRSARVNRCTRDLQMGDHNARFSQVEIPNTVWPKACFLTIAECQQKIQMSPFNFHKWTHRYKSAGHRRSCSCCWTAEGNQMRRG